MPLDRLVLIIVACIAALVAMIYGLALLIGALSLGPFGFLVLIPAGIVVYICVRVLQERMSNKEDDYYDRFDH